MKPGIDIDLGNTCSRIAYAWAKKSFALRAGLLGEVCDGMDGSFSTILRFGPTRIGISSDGIGTKIEVAERMGVYRTLGHDLVAMVVDDLVANGVRPTTLSNILDVDSLDPRIVDELMAGLYEAASLAGVVVSGGEIAELGSRVSGWGNRMHFNWCATGIGFIPEGEDPIDGTKVRVGDAILALRSQGFRSNGFSRIRLVLEGAFGPSWHTTCYDEARTWGEVVLTPSRIFAPGIVRLLDKGIHVAAIAHITGGGIPDNLARPLKARGLGARLTNLFTPWPFMTRLQEIGGVSDEDAYRTWNMGNGMLLVVPCSLTDAALTSLRDSGYEAQRAGEVIEEPCITIERRGPSKRVLRWPL